LSQADRFIADQDQNNQRPILHILSNTFHQLPIEWRIRFKLACLVHKILTTGHPPYLTELLQYHKPARSTPVTYFLFRDTTSHLVRALSASLRRKYGTPYLVTSANPKHTLPPDVILRRILLSFSPSCLLAAPVMRRPDSLPRLWRYINLLLTYLLNVPDNLYSVIIQEDHMSQWPRGRVYLVVLQRSPSRHEAGSEIDRSLVYTGSFTIVASGDTPDL